MAAAVITGTHQPEAVFGQFRRIGYSAVQFLNNGDTLTVGGLRQIWEINLTPITLPPGTWYFTFSGNVITLVSASGSITFSGGVLGI